MANKDDAGSPGTPTGAEVAEAIARFREQQKAIKEKMDRLQNELDGLDKEIDTYIRGVPECV